MKKILLIATGGTIASTTGKHGLSPTVKAEELVKYVPEIREFCETDCIQPFKYRQHERHAFALAYSCENDPRKLRKIRRVRGVPRNGYDGIHRRGAFVSGTKFAEADCAYGFTEADR